MGSRPKHRWKLPSFHRSPSSSSTSAAASPSSSSPATAAASPPVEFLCQISGALMADPVIIPSGQTFERGCIQACKDLAISPPPIAGDIDPSSLLLIPNSALHAAILNWCDRSGHPRPVPLDAAAARRLVARLSEAPAMAAATTGSPPSSSSPSSYHSSSSSYSSSEIVHATEDDGKPAKSAANSSIAEEEYLVLARRLKDRRISEQEAALADLRSATREGSDRRIALCTPTILAALRPLLLSRRPSIQSGAAAAVVNLSLEAVNKVPVVRSGVVPPLVEALRCGTAAAKGHAAAAIFSLSMEDKNRAAIGALGGVPPLLWIFCRTGEDERARIDAGMAIYHLSLAATNRTKIARLPGAVRAILCVASEEEDGMRKVAMMVVCSLAGGGGEGRTALMDAGAVGRIAAMVSTAADEVEVEHCVAAFYGMSRGSLRFRGLAAAAGVEAAMSAAAAEGFFSDAAREMAKRVVEAMRGEEDDGEASAGGRSVKSDGALLLRRRWVNLAVDSDSVNSAEF